MNSLMLSDKKAKNLKIEKSELKIKNCFSRKLFLNKYQAQFI